MGLLSKLFSSSSHSEPEITVTISDSETPTRNKREFSDNDPTLLESIKSNDTYQPSQKLPLSDVCPYCGVIQDKPVGRKKTCPHCKQVMSVRTTQDLFPSSLLTSEQVAHVDFYALLKNVLFVTKDDYNNHERLLAKKWNTNKVNTYDILWSMYNDIKLLQRSVDNTQEKKWALIQMFRNQQTTTIGAAQYQANRGYDPTPYLKTAQAYSLKMAKLQDDVKGLIVESYSCCDTCTKFHNKTFSLDFIEKSPVLPIKSCTHPFEDGSKFVFCTCRYAEYRDYGS